MQLSPEDQPPSEENSDLEPSGDVQEGWETLSDAEEKQDAQRETACSSDGVHTTSTTHQRKKRRVQAKTTTPTSPNGVKTRPAKGRKKVPIMEKEKLQEAIVDGARFTAAYLVRVVGHAIDKAQRPLSWFLILWFCAWLASWMTPAFRMMFSPLCILPGMSKSALCVPVATLPPINFEKLVNIQGSTFEQLVEESAGSSQLSINVLKAEMATRDLSTLVRYSDLKSKDNIADMLGMIGMDAKKTSRGLSRLDARVVGTIDEVMALNDYAMTTIKGAHDKAPSRLLRAISPIRLGPTADEIIAGAFTLAMDESEKAMEKLICEAEESWKHLQQLEADIGTLHEIVFRENKHTTTERDELLGELWTQLGGHKKAVQIYGDRLSLLNDLGEYKREAAAHVEAALRALYTMSDDLEVLRDRVAAPGLLESKVPLHVHMESIRNGLERLQAGRTASRGRGTDDVVKSLLQNPSE